MIVRKWFFSVLAFMFYSALRATWRVRVHETPELREYLSTNRLFVIAHWHGDELGILYLLRRYGCAVITSTSKDGEIINQVVNLMGAKSSRGSSTRGGVSALKGIIRLAREGYRPTVAVDGPKGPLHVVKPGVFEISKIVSAPIFPISVACSRKFVFEKSWNKTFLALPFARLEVVWGTPLDTVGKDTDCHSKELSKSLESALFDAQHKASKLIAAHQGGC